MSRDLPGGKVAAGGRDPAGHQEHWGGVGKNRDQSASDTNDRKNSLQAEEAGHSLLQLRKPLGQNWAVKQGSAYICCYENNKFEADSEVVSLNCLDDFQ